MSDNLKHLTFFKKNCHCISRIFANTDGIKHKLIFHSSIVTNTEEQSL